MASWQPAWFGLLYRTPAGSQQAQKRYTFRDSAGVWSPRRSDRSRPRPGLLRGDRLADQGVGSAIGRHRRKPSRLIIDAAAPVLVLVDADFRHMRPNFALG